jgi:peptide/nickel transport system substrate-binding protein
MPKAMLEELPGLGDLAKSRAEARKIMESLGYGPDKPLKVKVATRNIPIYRDPAVILIDQLKQIYIEGELEAIDTPVWHAKVARKDYQVGMNLTGLGVDDPDVNFYENFTCKSERNYTGYCNPDVEKLIDTQSRETDREKRKKIVWEVDRKLAEDGARPVIMHNVENTCWQPHVKGIVLQHNSIYNSWRFEDIWLDK